MDPFSDIIITIINSFLGEVINFVNQIVVLLKNTILNIFEYNIVKEGIKYAQALAFVLLIAKVIHEGINIYILNQSGDPDSNISNFIIRIVQALVAIFFIPVLVKEVFKFGGKITNDVSNLETFNFNINSLLDQLKSVFSTGFLFQLLALFLLIGIIIIVLQASVRAAELALMTVLGPIIALNITSANRSMFIAWIKEIILLCTTQAIQLYMLIGAISISSSIFFTNRTLEGIFLLFGWIFMTIKAPKFLKQITHSTGVASTLGRGARSSTSYFVRHLVTKGK